MKLKELLVQELPKFGGWPDECVFAAYRNGFVHYYIDDHGVMRPKPFYLTRLAILPDDYIDAIVTREQYEAALAAAQKVEWDGVALPPVGSNIEARFEGDWVEVTVAYSGCPESHGDASTWNEALVFNRVTTRPFWADEFRPIRSEADKKRKETIDLMDKRFKEVLAAGSTEAMAIFATVYDTILAGKIPSGHIE